MSNRLRLRITGLQELRHAIKAYGEAVVRDAVEAVTDAVDDTAMKAKYLARKKSGRMQASVTGRVSTDGYRVRGTVRVTATSPDDSYPYPVLQEFGSARIAKAPFLVPPAIRNRRRLNRELRASVVTRAPEALGTPTIVGDGPATPRMGID